MGAATIYKFTSLNIAADTHRSIYNEAKSEEVRRLITDAVKRRLVAARCLAA